MALWFPYLPAERVLRQRFGRSWRSSMPKETAPLVFSRRKDNTQRIVALDARARHLPLRLGMGIAEARAIHPALDVVESDAQSDRRLLDSLADWCDRYTPLVAIDGEDGLFLDITGCAHLFGGERAMLDDLLLRFFHLGFDVRAALASTPGAAWALARFGDAAVEIQSGEESEALAPLPLAALRLDAKVCEGLESVGLRTAGSLMEKPRAPLVRRFGSTVMLRLDQALGRVEEAVSPRLPVPPLTVERSLAEPISLREDVEALVLLLARRLKVDLERRGEGAERLGLQLFRVDGQVSRIAVGASRPLRDPGFIRKLFHERLAVLESEIDAGYGFDLVRLSVLVAAPMQLAQGDLDGSTSDTDGDLALFADRLCARLGDRSIRRSHIVESHVPERAGILTPFSQKTQPAAKKPQALEGLLPDAPKKERPARLFTPPECVDVTVAEVPEGPPLHFRWRRASYRVTRSEGPERIAGEWWNTQASMPTRDYFRVEDEDGRRFWLFREGLYGSPEADPRWFMQGIFA